MALINKNALKEKSVLKADTKFFIFDPNSKQENAGNETITWENVKAEIQSEVVDLTDLDLSGTLTVDTINEHTASAGVTIDGVLIKNGGITSPSEFLIVGFYNTVAAQNNITAGTGGAIIVTNYCTTINTDAGGDAFTLADGSGLGQLKKIRLVVDGGGDAVITPATASGFTTITMNDANDFVELIWTSSGWKVLENNGCTVA